MKNFKAQLLEEARPQRKGLSFKKLAVNHSTQEFVLRDGELEMSLGKEIVILLVAEYGQYFHYDTKLERVTVLSQITRPFEIKEALDLKSGKKMKEVIEKMGQYNTKPTYSDILVCLVKVGEVWEDVIFYVKGAVLSSWFDIVKELRKLETSPIGNFIELSLRPQKKGSVKYATLDLKMFKVCEDDDPLLEKAISHFKKFKEEIKAYNLYEPVKEEIPVEIEEGAEDEDIPF